MGLVDEVTAAIGEAMRRQEVARLSALRMLKAALMNKSVEKNRDLTEAEDLQVVGARRSSGAILIEQFQKAGRQDLVDKELAEITILDTYLPPAADHQAIERAVAEAIAETGATSPKDMGRVMKAALARLAGQTADGKVVNETVRRMLSAS